MPDSRFELERLDSIEAVAAEWDELADRCGAPPWVRPGWMDAWWDAFGSGTLELLTLRDDGRLEGLAPLARVGRGVRSLTNWHTPGWRLLASGQPTRESLAREIFRPGPRQVDVGFLDRAEPSLGALRDAALGAGFRLHERPSYRSPFIDIEGSWEDYRPAGSSTARNVRKRRRRLEEEGELTFELAAGQEGLAERLEEAYAIEASGWKGERGTAINSRPETRRFYDSVSGWAAKKSWFRLATLRFDDRLIAVALCVESGGRLHMVKSGYDDAMRAHGPGVILRQELLKYAFESELDGFEFLGVESPQKLQWTTSAHEMYQLQAFAPSVGGTARWAMSRYGRPLAKRAVTRASELRGRLRRD